MASSSEIDPTLALLTSLDTTITTLRSSLSAILAQGSPSTASTEPTSQNPQKSLSDALTVLEAQTTKVTLVLTNPPLAYGAVREVVTDLVARVLPAVFSGAAYIVERPEVWGKFYVRSVANKVDAVFTAVINFSDGTRDIVGGKVLQKQRARGKTASKEDEKVKEELYVLAGKVFELSRTTAKFVTDGVAKCLLDRTKEAIELLQDAMEEMKDWSEDVDDSADPDGDDSEEEEEAEPNGVAEKFHSLSIDEMEDIKQLPAHRTDLRDLLSESLRRVELVVKLFQATSKRRIKKFPDPKLQLRDDDSSSIETHNRNTAALDVVVDRVQDTSEEMDEMAHGFYQLDKNKAEARLAIITKHAKEVAAAIKLDWDGNEDDFSGWLSRWESLIDRKKSLSSVASSAA
jgi:Grap2 and cyclin-D-interacting